MVAPEAFVDRRTAQTERVDLTCGLERAERVGCAVGDVPEAASAADDHAMVCGIPITRLRLSTAGGGIRRVDPSAP